jgi:hypothetical protein
MTDTSWLGPAIDTRPVLAEQQTAFIDLLRRLDDGEWAQPTICPGWNVKDVAAHGRCCPLIIVSNCTLIARRYPPGAVCPTVADGPVCVR